MVVAETPFAVLPNSDSTLDESVTSKKTDSILRAATQDLLTLMKLDVRAPLPPRAGVAGRAWVGGRLPVLETLSSEVLPLQAAVPG